MTQGETVRMQCLISECSNTTDKLRGWQLYGNTSAIVYLIYPIEVTVMGNPLHCGEFPRCLECLQIPFDSRDRLPECFNYLD